MKLFYEDVEQKRNGRKMRLQTNQEFLQNKIKNLNLKYNLDMFTTHRSGRKAFTTE